MPKPDATFTIQEGQAVCEQCDRPMADHKAIEGEGKFKGWTRYRCIDADD